MDIIDDLRQKVATACRLLLMEELIDFSGHISARIPGTDRVLINPFAVSRADVRADHIATVDLAGQLVEGKYEAPSETPIHTCIYRARSDVLSVAHIHPHYATLFAIAGRPLVPVTTHGAVFAGPVPVYHDPDHVNDDRRGQALAKALGSARVVLMRGHGATVVGESVEACFTACVYLEENARRQLFSSILGTPIAFDEDEIRRVTASTWKEKTFKKVWDYFESRARNAGVI
ncbi:MAG: class II aldolase/adducin family protein [Chloroflexi bacterium]|nr:class II aldolase/adducin family protein [Chloroflexota bacterium]